MRRIPCVFLYLAATAWTLAPLGVSGQAFPAKPVRVVVPFPPGGALDLTARLLGQKLQASLGQPFVVDNRPGATGAIGEELVLRSAPDGYTLLYTAGSDMAIKKILSKTAKYDPVKDFTPIATAVASISCIVASSALPVNSIKELLDHAKRNPCKLTYGSPGVASYMHLTGELLKQHGVDMVHVPFKGLAPAVTALAGGQIDVAITNFATVMPHLRDGKARMLSVMDAKRYEGAPNVPTVAEALPGFDMPLAWYGFFGPPGLPQPIVSKLNAEIAKALEAPEVSSKLREINVTTIITPADRLPGFISNMAERFGNIIKKAGIQPVD